ncbi:helix-turn-helix domain-containing protein [Agromyces salentinus]|uniref:HTH luxR-type domain-containing protein n=1 Tax=Agromyces salentinus TaxID=269421 RepID=A0ABN2MTI2_9MICO|nr:helix-turn-helix transcriptional regulator [Agromyces salentinus]
MNEEPRQQPRHRSTVEAFEGSDAIVEMLAQHRIFVAPHVAARLGLGLGGDADAIIQVAGALRGAQRLGLASLPDPLPLVPAIDEAVGDDGERLAPWESQALVVAAVCIDDRIDVLLAATGRSMADLVSSGLSRQLLLVAGHFAFADPRTRVWAHAHASLAERTAAHAALAEAYAVLQVVDQATWHRSLATLEGSGELVEPLLAIAERADAAGEAERAHAVAREAASLASGGNAVRAQSIAGRAALHAGFVEEAERWFGEVLNRGDEHQRVAVLADYLIAVALLTGDVPDRELDELLERSRRGEALVGVDRARFARAMLIAAGLLAERGTTHRAAMRLAQARELLDGSERSQDEWRVAYGWCSLFGGAGFGAVLPDAADTTPAPAAEPPAVPVASLIGTVRAMTEALERGLAGDAGSAARRLGMRRDVPGTEEAPAVSCVERSPMMRAERAVAIALLELWAGEVRRAADGLRQAASDLPIGLAFGGLGAALARRVELISTGTIGAWARSVEAVLPQPVLGVRREDLVDRAMWARLNGRRSEAETLVALADERARTGFGSGLHLPGLDAAAEELGDAGSGRVGHGERPASAPSAGRRTPDARLASELRHRMRSIDRSGFEGEYAAVAERARGIASPYERARTELMLARVCASFGAVDRADRHLLAAEHLFGDCGANGWLAAVAEERRAQAGRERAGRAEADNAGAGARPSSEARRGRGDGPRPSATGAVRLADAPAASVPPTTVVASAADASDLVECRDAWAELLTERELEVAMLVVEGISNRDAAARLFVSVRTVEVHVGRVFSKLAVHSRVELAVLAHRMRGRMSGTHT